MAAAGTIVNLSSTISVEGEAFLPDSGRPSGRPLFVRRGRALDGHPGARHSRAMAPVRIALLMVRNGWKAD